MERMQLRTAVLCGLVLLLLPGNSLRAVPEPLLRPTCERLRNHSNSDCNRLLRHLQAEAEQLRKKIGEIDAEALQWPLEPRLRQIRERLEQQLTKLEMWKRETEERRDRELKRWRGGIGDASQ